MAGSDKRETDTEGQIDRRISIEDVFEHVIAGVRLGLLLRILREATS
jgi:hypothetical protein